jgi:hypothetical protein
LHSKSSYNKASHVFEKMIGNENKNHPSTTNFISKTNYPNNLPHKEVFLTDYYEEKLKKMTGKTEKLKNKSSINAEKKSSS